MSEATASSRGGSAVPRTALATNARLPLFTQELRRSRRGLIGWVIGNAAAILLYLPFFPSITAGPDMAEYFNAFPPEVTVLFGLDQLATGAGYTQATYFALTGLLLFAIAAVSWGARAIAGDEEDGGLELTLAHGVTRTQVVAERALAVAARLVLLALSGALVIAALDDVSRLSLDLVGLAAASTALVGLALLIGMAALFAGAASGRRSTATAVGAGVAVLAYILDAVSRTASVPWLGAISPVRWAFGADPLTTGFDWGGLALLLGGAVLLLAAATFVFGRRDVGMQ